MKLTATDARNLRTLVLASVFEAEEIGRRIAQARHERGLTQEDLADLVGVSTRSQQGYEAGAVIPYKHMVKYEAILGRPVPWFLHGEQVSAQPERESADIAVSFTRLLEILEANPEALAGFREELEGLAVALSAVAVALQRIAELPSDQPAPTRAQSSP